MPSWHHILSALAPYSQLRCAPLAFIQRAPQEESWPEIVPSRQWRYVCANGAADTVLCMHAGPSCFMGMPPKPPPLPPTGRAAKPAAPAPCPGAGQATPQALGAHGASARQAREEAAALQTSTGPPADNMRRRQDEKSKVLPRHLMNASQRLHTIANEMPLRPGNAAIHFCQMT